MPFDLGSFTQDAGWKIPSDVSASPHEKGSFIERYRFEYNYTDGRFDKYRKDNSPIDVTVLVYKFETPEKAGNYLNKERNEGAFGKAIPEEKYPKMRMCSEAEAENGATDERPPIITKTFVNPRGGNLQVMANGFHIANNCQLDTKNSGGYAIWTDGIYAFLAESSGYSEMKQSGQPDQGHANVKDFASDYVAAMTAN